MYLGAGMFRHRTVGHIVTMQAEMFADRCQRCGIACAPGGPGNPEAQLLRRANCGVCVTCGVALFIKATPSMMIGIKQHGPAMLLAPHIQEGFARLLASGKADARPDEIDWSRLVDQWDLP